MAETTTTSVPTGGGGSLQVSGASNVSGGSNTSSSSGTTPTPAAGSAPATPTPVASPSGAAPASTPEAGGKPWSSGMAEKYQGLVQTKGWTGMDAMAESYVNLEKLVGVPDTQLIRLPTKADDKPAYDAIFTKLGAPADPKGYGFTPEEGSDPAFTDGVAKIFHDGKLTVSQAHAVREGWNNLIKGMQTSSEAAAKKAHDDGVTGLKKEWQTGYDMNLAMAEQAMTAFGLKREDLLNPKFSLSGPELVKFMHRISEGLGEAKFHLGQPAGQGMSKAQALHMKETLMKDKAWQSRYASGDQAAKDQMWQITQALAGGQ